MVIISEVLVFGMCFIVIQLCYNELGAIFILCKDIGVGGWSRKWQFFLTLCSENILT